MHLKSWGGRLNSTSLCFKRRQSSSGFTLIELLVVIAIIGLLATLSVLALQNARINSRDAKRLADVKQLRTALELYYNDAGHYPSIEEFNSGKIEYYSPGQGTTTYMFEIPSAPTPPDGDCSASDNSYEYVPLGDLSFYNINFCIAKDNGDLPKGILAADPNGIHWSGDAGGEDEISGSYFANYLNFSNNNSFLSGIIPVNGGFIGVGTSLGEVFMSKMDSTGQEVWRKNVGESEHDLYSANDIIASENGYVIAAAGDNGLYLIGFDADGNEQWSKSYVTGDYGDIYSLTRLTNQDYLLVGYQGYNEGDDYQDALIIRTSSTGDQILRTVINIDYEDSFNSVEATADGGYVIAASVYQGSTSGNYQGLVIKFNSSNVEEWRTALGDHNAGDNLYSNNIEIASDGGYLVTSSVYDLSNYLTRSDGYSLAKVGPSGSLDWHYAINDYNSGSETITYSKAFEGGYLIGGIFNGSLSVSKIDSSGTVVWIEDIFENTMGDDYWSGVRGLESLGNGDYLIAGTAYLERYYSSSVRATYPFFIKTNLQRGVSCQDFCESANCADEDGCGGTCDNCQSGTVCFESSCCVPDCSGGNVCGDNGCGGVCGTCQAGFQCLVDDCKKEWTMVGSSFSEGAVRGTDLAFNSNIPYVMHSYYGAVAADLTASRFTNNAWETVGEPGISGYLISGSKTSLVFNGTTPYIAFESFDSGTGYYKLSVMKFEGGAWVYVGPPQFCTSESGDFDLEFDSSGGLYLAYLDLFNYTRPVILKFDGSSWQPFGGGTVSSYYSSSIDLDFDGDTPYIAYIRENSGRANVVKYDGASWVNVGYPDFSWLSEDKVVLKIDNHIPYVAIFDQNDNYFVKLMKFTDAPLPSFGWEPVGTTPSLAYSSSLSDIIFEDGVPYVSFLDQYYSGRPVVARYINSAWETVGHPLSMNCSEYNSFGINNGSFYISCSGFDDYNYKAILMTLTE